jgi:hypothetical protein
LFTKLKNQSIAKVEGLHELQIARSGRKGSRRFGHNDLPAGTAGIFTSRVLPLARDRKGVTKPWEDLSEGTIIHIWNTYQAHPFKIAPVKNQRDVNGDALLCVVKRLVSRYIIIIGVIGFDHRPNRFNRTCQVGRPAFWALHLQQSKKSLSGKTYIPTQKRFVNTSRAC